MSLVSIAVPLLRRKAASTPIRTLVGDTETGVPKAGHRGIRLLFTLARAFVFVIAPRSDICLIEQVIHHVAPGKRRLVGVGSSRWSSTMPVATTKQCSPAPSPTVAELPPPPPRPPYPPHRVRLCSTRARAFEKRGLSRTFGSLVKGRFDQGTQLSRRKLIFLRRRLCCIIRIQAFPKREDNLIDAPGSATAGFLRGKTTRRHRWTISDRQTDK